MKKPLQVALVCAGAVNRASLARAPLLLRRVLWVKAKTSSAASRVANAIGFGTPVRTWHEIAAADVVILRVPEEDLASYVDDMTQTRIDWRRRTIVLVDSSSDSSALASLETAGAWPASLNWMRVPAEWAMIEGHREAVRRLKPFLRPGSVPLVEIRRGGKADYLEGVRIATECFMPLVADAVEQFVRAGMQKAAAEATAASLFSSSVRTFLRAGRRVLPKQSP